MSNTAPSATSGIANVSEKGCARFSPSSFSRFFLLAPSDANNSPRLTEDRAAVVREMNLVRQHPDVYARYLEELRAHFRGDFLVFSGRTMVHTHEGVAAIDEAIRFDFAGGYVESRPASRSLLARN